jgi:hypothetical protein
MCSVKRTMVLLVMVLLFCLVASADPTEYYGIYASGTSKTGNSEMTATVSTNGRTVTAASHSDEHLEIGEADAWVVYFHGYIWTDEGNPTGGTLTWEFTTNYRTSYARTDGLLAKHQGSGSATSSAEAYIAVDDYKGHLEVDGYTNGIDECEANSQITVENTDWSTNEWEEDWELGVPSWYEAVVDVYLDTRDPCPSYGEWDFSAGDWTYDSSLGKYVLLKYFTVSVEAFTASVNIGNAVTEIHAGAAITYDTTVDIELD